MPQFDVNRDYYYDLGLNCRAMAEEIKKKGRELDAEYTKVLQVIAEARKVLEDPGVRAEYDDARRQQHAFGRAPHAKQNAWDHVSPSTFNPTTATLSPLGDYSGTYVLRPRPLTPEKVPSTPGGTSPFVDWSKRADDKTKKVGERFRPNPDGSQVGEASPVLSQDSSQSRDSEASLWGPLPSHHSQESGIFHMDDIPRPRILFD
ncbi:hypothetical protein EKO27_g150 [Xylaria grammica]|uniref:J domain-containing protein n=1 Tax=Xylaria grammica TaxID=363999 RepID=A0A439DKM7_9PEZI|nr:hypothetical protein EKO27_g150 [Xylaria grammica]